MAPEAVAFSDDGRGVQSADMMRSVMCEAARLGKVVARTADNSLLHGGYIHDGGYARAHGHRGICSESEYRPIARDIELCRETGCAYHVCHISTRERRADPACQGRGRQHHLRDGTALSVLDENALREDGRFKMNPPALRRRPRGTAGGTAGRHDRHDRHRPCAAYRRRKSRGAGRQCLRRGGTGNGISRAVYTLVRTGILSLELLLERMVWAPRRGFRSAVRPGIRSGCRSRDLSAARPTDPAEFLSMGRATPFAGDVLYGINRMTLWHGQVVYSATDGKESAQ